jgi:hypothetical protein
MKRESTPSSRLPLRLAALGIAALSCIFPVSPVGALEEGAGEAKVIDACDKRLCEMVQQKNPSGEDLKCALTKTFARSTIKEADQRVVKWSFGDARCTVQINLGRGAIVAAVSNPEAKLKVPPHTANCIVEQDGEVKTITATLAPKIVFKDGRAEKIWINLLKVDGPPGIKATLSTAAQLNDTIGLFHRAMLKSVNGYIYKHCPKYHPQTQAATATPAKPAPAKPAKAGEPTPRKQGG